MRPALVILLLSTLLACSTPAHKNASSADARTPLQLSLASQARTDADRQRDARDQPEEVLAVAGFKPGDHIADVFGGGGYYSEILSGLVGAHGQVDLINNPPYDAYAKKDLEPRLAGNRLKNVRYFNVPTTALEIKPQSLDGALIILSFHDLYAVDVEGGWPAIDAPQFLKQVYDGLKPGAVLLIVDHYATAGTGTSVASSLHRIDPAHATRLLSDAGFEFDGALELLRNPADDLSKNVFDAAIRGKTDRFVHQYRKR